LSGSTVATTQLSGPPLERCDALLDGTDYGSEFLMRTPIFFASDAAGFVTGHMLAVDGSFWRAASIHSVNHAQLYRSAKPVSGSASGSEIQVNQQHSSVLIFEMTISARGFCCNRFSTV
jgi:hypothetical protein